MRATATRNMMKPMRHVVFLAAIAGAVAAAIACGSGKLEQLSDVGGEVLADSGGGAVLPNAGPAGSGLATGLPCDVQAIIENRCIGCHTGATLGSPPLQDYEDLKAPSKSDPTMTMAQASLARMKDPLKPMPPVPAAPPDADEIATFEAWVNAGTPSAGACTEPPLDGGADVGPLPEAGPDATAGCASGTMWTQGNTESPLMYPGRACNACHSMLGGPNLKFAGTVYRGGLHDIDDCNGAAPPPPLTVVITDRDNKTMTIPVNAAGNFELEAPKNGGQGQGQGQGQGGGGNKFSPPYRVRVTDGTLSRAMAGNFTSGDCNSCHTRDGINNAPGRILAPEP